MKKLLFSLAAVIIFSATASAQGPAPTPIVSSGGGSCGAAPVAAPAMPYYGGYGGYGYGAPPAKAGFFRRLFGGGGGPTLPAAQGGQLAFPVNPFIRSPRDFFMYD